MGPLKRNDALFEKITKCFNSIDRNIKFTTEVPDDGILNFLDLSIWIDESGRIVHQKYTKELASGNSLKKDSWLPNSIKANFVHQKFKDIEKRSSDSLTEDDKSRLVEECKRNLRNNGYSDRDLIIAKSKSSINVEKVNDKSTSKSTLKLPFISDSLSRKINYNIRKYDLDINFVCHGNKKLRNVFSQKISNKHSNCELCKKLPNRYSCDMTCVIYQFSCKFCDRKYMGKTARPFNVRYNEHKNSIKNNNSIGAPSDHRITCNEVCSIDDFNVEILKRVHDPVEASLVEARMINSLNPAMNRRHETAAAIKLCTL